MRKFITYIALLSLGISKAMPEVRNAISGDPIEIPAAVLTVQDLRTFLGERYATNGSRVRIKEPIIGPAGGDFNDVTLRDSALTDFTELRFFMQGASVPIPMPQVDMPTDQPFPAFDTLPAEWRNYLRDIFQNSTCNIIVPRLGIVLARDNRPLEDQYNLINAEGVYNPIHIFMNGDSGIRPYPRVNGDVIISVPTVNDDYLTVLYRNREVFSLNEQGTFLPIIRTHPDLPTETYLFIS